MSPLGRLTRVSRSWVLPCLVGLLVFLYRFNTLGGELGGFDNDHFISLARAHQLLDGEWPLRDYADASLGGAWPPLSYLTSAAAQIVFGRSLLAEAFLTTGAVAAAAALTTLAGRALGLPETMAFGAAIVSVLPSVKLYGYARPLLFASGALLLFRYVNVPSRGRLVALSVLTAVAFLFRHDYAAYLAVGATVTVLVRHRSDPMTGAARLIACGAITALLLVPTMVTVHYLVGLGAYVDSARALMADEVLRTNLKWPSFDLAALWSEQNTLAWAYYAYLALPPAAALAAVWRARHHADDTELPKVLGLAAVGAVANQWLLRGNLEARLADPAVLHGLMGMWFVTITWQAATRVEPGRARRVVTAALTSGVAAVTVLALGRVGAADREFRTAGFHEGPLITVRTTARTFGRLRELPPARWEPLPESGAMLAAAYLSRCTRPTDRIINTTYDTEHLVFAKRRFAAGRVNFVPGFYASEREQMQAVALARAQAAPVAFTDPPPNDDWLEEDFPIFNAFLRERYVDAGTINRRGEPHLRVLALRDLRPRGTFANTGLPCFQ
jgi:hypothetical protein